MMKRLVVLVMVVFGAASLQAQIVKEMRWAPDFKLQVKLSNDTTQVLDVRALQHSGSLQDAISQSEATYFPVSLDEEFVKTLKDKKVEMDKALIDSSIKSSNQTLWSALHTSLGGGYIHFINCIMYALESGHLNLSDPIMQRPPSKWKPNPMTESFRRTKKWGYYIPLNQKLAQKEFKTQEKNNEHHDIMVLPADFRVVFHATNEKEYLMMKAAGNKKEVAKIDIIRMLLGSRYLGENQIKYIKAKVLIAISQYSANNLPSVIMFDDLNAAVAMSLSAEGYRIDQIVFKDVDSIDQQEIESRTTRIGAFIRAINEANDRVFKKRLSTYYGN